MATARDANRRSTTPDNAEFLFVSPVDEKAHARVVAELAAEKKISADLKKELESVNAERRAETVHFIEAKRQQGILEHSSLEMRVRERTAISDRDAAVREANKMLARMDAIRDVEERIAQANATAVAAAARSDRAIKNAEDRAAEAEKAIKDAEHRAAEAEKTIMTVAGKIAAVEAKAEAAIKLAKEGELAAMERAAMARAEQDELRQIKGSVARVKDRLMTADGKVTKAGATLQMIGLFLGAPATGAAALAAAGHGHQVAYR